MPKLSGEEGLGCPICFERYDDPQRCPRVRICGHTFCSGCLRHLLQDGAIACPRTARTSWCQRAAQELRASGRPARTAAAAPERRGPPVRGLRRRGARGRGALPGVPGGPVRGGGALAHAQQADARPLRRVAGGAAGAFS